MKKPIPRKKRFVIHEARGAKLDRYSVFDVVTRRDIKGRLSKYAALGLRAELRGNAIQQGAEQLSLRIAPRVTQLFRQAARR